MQRSSLMGSRGPAPGGLVMSSPRSSSALQAMPSLMSPSPQQQSGLQFDHGEHHHHTPAMDECLEQMFGLPSWSDMGGNAGRSPWDFNGAGGGATRLTLDAQKLFSPSQLLPLGLMGAHDGPNGHGGATGLHSNDDNLLSDHRLRGLQDNSSHVPGIVSRGGLGTSLTRSPSEGSSGSEIEGSATAAGPQSPPPVAPTWRQPYVGGVPPLPLGLGQAKAEPHHRADTSDAHLGKRPGDDDDVSMRETHAGGNIRDSTDGLFAAFTTPLSQTQLPFQQGNGTSSQGLQSGHPVPVYGNSAHPAAAVVAPQAGAGVAAIAARPRVRARRGQATDPHSIAERLRRERIAERMKALQELVPNSNKTDKASMLDEIIDYVKFLQLQVKVLSMSRLGGAGAVAPLTDLPSDGSCSNYVPGAMGRGNGVPGATQEGMALTERQVADLMERDMGSAMQYLQSKGLCLMPISIASAISSTTSRSQAGNHGGAQGTNDRQPSESMSAAAGSLSNAGPSNGPALQGAMETLQITPEMGLTKPSITEER